MADPIFVEDLRKKELEELSYLSKSNKGLDKRAKIILLSNEGYTVSDISRNIGMHYQNVRKWIHRFSDSGIRGLYHGNKGRKNKLKYKEEIRKRIAETAILRPEALGLSSTNWTLEKLKKYLVNKKIVSPNIAIETIRNILTANGIAWRRLPQRQLPHTLSRTQCGIMLQFDNKGKVAIEKGKESSSNDKKKNTFIEQELTIKGPPILFAGYNPLTNKLVVRVYKKI